MEGMKSGFNNAKENCTNCATVNTQNLCVLKQCTLNAAYKKRVTRVKLWRVKGQRPSELTHQLIGRMLCEADRSKAVSTTGQQRDNDMHKGDPVGEVHPERKQTTTVGCCFTHRPDNHREDSRSPAALQVFQLFLDVTADAVAVVPVQPLPQHTHANLTFAFVKDKTLHC